MYIFFLTCFSTEDLELEWFTKCPPAQTRTHTYWPDSISHTLLLSNLTIKLQYVLVKCITRSNLTLSLYMYMCIHPWECAEGYTCKWCMSIQYLCVHVLLTRWSISYQLQLVCPWLQHCHLLTLDLIGGERQGEADEETNRQRETDIETDW